MPDQIVTFWALSMCKVVTLILGKGSESVQKQQSHYQKCIEYVHIQILFLAQYG